MTRWSVEDSRIRQGGSGLKRRLFTGTVLALFLLLALSTLSHLREERGELGLVEVIGVETVAPLQKGFDRVSGAMEAAWNSYVNLVRVREENRKLKEEVRRLQEEVNRYEEIRLENRRLRNLLGFKKRTRIPLLPAEVVAHDPSDWFRTLIIDKGARAGIRRDMAVVCHEGIVGRVIAVSADYSKILLIQDRSSAVSALLQRGRTRGILEGSGGDGCLLRFVSPSKEVRVGDVVVSSGLNGIFPKGLLLGRVESVTYRPGDLFQSIRVRPATNLATLEEVFVVMSLSPPRFPAAGAESSGTGDG